MQFSTVFVALFAASAFAAPMEVTPRDDALTGLQNMAASWVQSKVASGCDKAKCVLALAPTAVSCAAAAVMAGADPIADAGCLVTLANDVGNKPAACTGC